MWIAREESFCEGGSGVSQHCWPVAPVSRLIRVGEDMSITVVGKGGGILVAVVIACLSVANRRHLQGKE